MLALSKAATALESLPAATRLISTSIAAYQDADDEPRSVNSRVRPSRQESYRAWGEQVYRSGKFPPEPRRNTAQHAAVQHQREQQQEGSGRRHAHWRQRQAQGSSKPMPPQRRQPGPGYDGFDGFRGNIVDKEETHLESKP